MPETSEPTLQAQTEAASAYETLMVPALFGQWAPRVADAARIEPGQRVLDVGCGTGVLAREVAARVSSNGSVVGLDPNPGMLEVARHITPDVEWRQGFAESLPFPDDSFDVVVGQFGLMFFRDPHEALRILSPGGRLAVAVWDSIENNAAYAVEMALLDQLAGREAADALRAPFVLGDRDRYAGLFAEAGARSVDVATERGRANFPSVRVMVEADLRGWLPVVHVVLSEERIEHILGEAETALESYVTSDGTVAFDTSAHIATGTKV